PLALLQLRTTGRCTVRLPEELFDMDGPGHYFRRIKTVSVSIPCVTGPYASVNCTLTLLKSSIRKTQVLRDGIYAREDAEDDRFSDYFGSLQSIVTSSAQNDSGLFETNLHDERYLPFENSGVVSEWQLELPADVRQFDYDTISDGILHLRYTAREGGGLLKNGAVSNLKTRIEEAQASGSVRLFSMRHEFPTEWAEFIKPDNTEKEMTLEIREEHFPYWSIGRLETVKSVEIFGRDDKNSKGIISLNPKASASELTTYALDGTKETVSLTELKNISLPKPPVRFILKIILDFDNNSMEDLWLALTWGKGDEGE
ncbi:MAG TPA: insecticidal toxin protein, partial [archaeon]|nr:insecticidal toxin protein [archaeon]